jgi:hypothetical protein
MSADGVESDVLRDCSICGQRKPLRDFYRKTATLYLSRCKECHKAMMRPRSKRHYESNKPYYRRRNIRRIATVAAYILAKKTGQVCADCRLPHPPWRLDFDHLDSSTKEINVSSISRRGWSLARTQEEIDKCDLVCANCHRDRTHARRQAPVIAKPTPSPSGTTARKKRKR